MEALDGTSRQSGLLSIINREEVDRIVTSRPYTSTMAATSLVSPTSMSMFPNGPPPPYSGWSGPPTHPSSGLISPPESRRTSENKSDPPPPIQTAPPHRQSLPSIHEALSSGTVPKPNPYVSPVSASLPPSHHQLPYSQSQAPSIPRTYSTEHIPYQPPQLAPSQPRRPSPPQPVQPHPHPFTRTDSIPTTFPESRHGSLTTSLQTAPGPPPNPYAQPRYEPARYEQESRASERMNGYTHHPPPTQQSSYQYGPRRMPPTVPPGPAYPQPGYQQRDGREPENNWKLREGYKAEPEFSHGLKRHLDVWDFENNLAQINTSSRVLMEWSHHYNAIAQEQQRGLNVIPDRMPTLDNCKEMIEYGEAMMQSLTRMKDMITQQEFHTMDQRMREQGGKGDYEDDMTMYGEGMDKHAFASSEGKKQRRGRAAPPGRCHSCNRAETPEWRRGPDGARTLCNACGLHYAKLTRKQTMRNSQNSQGSNGSSLRPKSMDDPSPRPI